MKSNNKAVKSAKKLEGSNPQVGNSDPAVHVVELQSPPVLMLNQGKPLSDDEKKLLLEVCTTDIREKQQAFFVVGYRLWQIREQQLYLLSHKTYQSFCNETFDFSKSHCNRLVQAYLCEQQLKSVKNIEVYVPTKESQVRVIVDLQPDQQVEVAGEVFEMVGAKTATTKDFEAAREKLYPKPVRPAKQSEIKDPMAKVTETQTNIVRLTFNPKLVSLADMKKRMDHLYNIYANPEKKQESLKLIGKLKLDLETWADWEANQIKGKEAA